MRSTSSGRAKSGRGGAFVERLTLDDKRIEAMAAGVLQVEALDDPVGTAIEKWTRPNGLKIEKIRVPIGVIAMIYESRPNVTVDAAALTLEGGQRGRAARRQRGAQQQRVPGRIDLCAL